MTYEKDPSKCDDCRDSGWAIVPHPNFCDAFEWKPSHHNHAGLPVFVTACVFCVCYVGRKFLECQRNEEKAGKAKAMTLEWYQHNVNGNWREQVRQRGLAADMPRVIATTKKLAA